MLFYLEVRDMRKLRGLLAVALAFIFIFSIQISANPVTDDFILSDPVRNTYAGRSNAADIITALQFTDIPQHHEYGESIARGGALGLIRGVGDRFLPDTPVTREAAIAFIMRMLDYERQAINIGSILTNEQGLSPAAHWSLGYLLYASTLGIISGFDYQDVLSETLGLEGSGRPEEQRFNRNGNATREEVAVWLHLALQSLNSSVFNPPRELTRVFTFNDWQLIRTESLIAVEDITTLGIMRPVDGNFNPQGTVNRQEMAQILADLDTVYFSLAGITQRVGTVGAIVTHAYDTSASSDIWRNHFIRTSDGSVDVIQYRVRYDLSPVSGTSRDVVVYREGRVGGLMLLEDGDMIEYLIRGNEVIYIWVVQPMVEAELVGQLHSVNTAENTITIRQDGNFITFSMIDGLLRQINNEWQLTLDGQRHPVPTLPYGNNLRFRFINGIITEISFVGTAEIIAEIRGIVVANQPNFGFLTILDNDGNTVTFRYFENDMLVRKLQHYDMSSGLSYFTQMFPNFTFDPNAARIREIDPGDIVFIRPCPEDNEVIAEISAATNYTMRYGRILQINRNPDYISILMQFENNQTAWFNVARGVFISRQGRPVSIETMQAGDWARLLVNEAIIGPGHVLRSVIEITLDGGEYQINTIIRGTVANINMIQRQMTVQNAQNLSGTGWTNHRNLANLNLNNPNIEFFLEDRPITLDYINRFLTRSTYVAYIAMENFPGGERIRKVTFREGREELLPPDTVSHASGTGLFGILSHPFGINADAGTIVRRHGRLVSQHDILPTDYLSVILTGSSRAAVVDIVQRPDTSQVLITRARVARVREGVSFTSTAIAQLHGNQWLFSPVQREFEIDHNTLFIDAGGFVPPEQFIGITENTVVDRVFNVITDGSRATHIIDAPYSTQSLRGTIFQIAGNRITLRDVFVHNPANNTWMPVSATNNFVYVHLYNNSIIARNNNIVQASALQPGDGLLVMTNYIPTPRVSGMEVDGYIVLVER
jgi:hypothetical protein